MKKFLMPLAFIFAFAAISLQSFGQTPSRVDGFVHEFFRLIGAKEREITEQEKDALRNVHPILLRAADHEVVPQFFWSIVRQAEPKSISWDEARNLIVKGKVVGASQLHSLDVYLVARDGRKYKTKGPRGDEVHKAIREVDPKGVFISYAME